ncbi:hypothetical protein [Zophobihabitans entericus]|uniref:Uncharacterized protein n=1 Tax=Zophobihabitans entericus TaxID=1635327 RepID=A0A6G9I9J9_9GAMM|nr:hypothetical protein [Zophobihabitans entericus]QIQ20905.1 hypothetical protein IPMB12_03930 [Zophobihabitans entericus]
MSTARSFFKLPILFTLINYVLLRIGHLVMLWFSSGFRAEDFQSGFMARFIFNSMASTLHELFIYFVIVAIACYYAKLHEVTKRNIVIILIGAICATILNLLLTFFWKSAGLLLFNTLSLLSQSWIVLTTVITLTTWLFYLTSLMLVALLIFFLLRWCVRSEQQTSSLFEMNAANLSIIHNMLFSGTIVALFMYFVTAIPNYIFPTYSDDLVHFVLVLLCLLLISGLHLFFIYFFVQPCFSQSYSTLQIIRLLKSIGIIVGILCVAMFITIIVIEVIFYLYLADQGFEIMIPFMIASFTALLVVYYVILLTCSRFAVRRYFSV